MRGCGLVNSEMPRCSRSSQKKRDTRRGVDCAGPAGGITQRRHGGTAGAGQSGGTPQF